MSVQTGKKLIDREIVFFGALKKQDNGSLPSYGPDGCGYTMRGAFLERSELVEIPSMGSLSIKTFESVKMPTNMIGLLYIKSTYARQGIILVTNSPVDPGYEGSLTIRLFNSGPKSVAIYTAGGLAMLIVHELNDSVAAYNGRHQKMF